MSRPRKVHFAAQAPKDEAVAWPTGVMCGTQIPLHGDFLATAAAALVTCGQCLKSWPTLGRAS